MPDQLLMLHGKKIKNGPKILFFIKLHQIFIFGLYQACSWWTCGFSVLPQILTLCRLTDSDRWNVASSENKMFPRNWGVPVHTIQHFHSKCLSLWPVIWLQFLNNLNLVRVQTKLLIQHSIHYCCRHVELLGSLANWFTWTSLKFCSISSTFSSETRH